MAELHSEDKDCPTRLLLSAGPTKTLSGRGADAEQTWQDVSLRLTSGPREIGTVDKEEVMLCRKPTDEIVDLLAALEQLLNKERDEILFEPSEPSFELAFARTRRGGIKVEAWLDAGNGTTEIYTWDAAGIRFYTTDANIRSFSAELRREFGLY